MRTLLAAAALLLAAPAAAQPRVYAFDEIASDLAYGLCPLLLANALPLDAPQLAERGFGTAIQKQPHARFGEIQIVGLKRPEGEIGFGGAPGKVCTVAVTGEGRAAALARLRSTMEYMGLDFKPAPHTGATPPGVTVETFKAPVEGQMLYVQHIQTGGPAPALLVNVFGMPE